MSSAVTEDSGFGYQVLMNPKELDVQAEDTVCVKEEVNIKEEPCENETMNVFDTIDEEHISAVKKEPKDEFDGSEAARGLYAEHEMRGALVVGPRELRRPKYDSTISSDELRAAVIPERNHKVTDTSIKVSKPRPEQQKKGKSTLESRLFVCDICKKNFNTKPKIISHMNVHKSEKPYLCKICNKWLKRKSALTLHLQRHAKRGQEPLTCEICQKQFPFQEYLDNHMKNVHSEKVYSCEICYKRFSCNYTLRRHEQDTHSDVKNRYPCEICKKRFSHKSVAADHKFFHTGEKPYGCDICKKKFREKRLLAGHQKFHRREQAENPYSCEVCNKRFPTENRLSHHMRIHRKDTLSCLVCKKKFMKMHNLSDHMRIHTGEKLYTCDICNKMFLLQSLLTEHKRTHMAKPYTCEICKEQYEEEKLYAAHMNECQSKRQLASLAEPPTNQVRHQVVIPLSDGETLSLTLGFK